MQELNRSFKHYFRYTLVFVALLTGYGCLPDKSEQSNRGLSESDGSAATDNNGTGGGTSGGSQNNSGPSSTVTFLAGDANKDGKVDRLDIEAICAAGKYDTNQPANWAEGDFNNDGISDFDDILAMFPNYKDDSYSEFKGCPTGSGGSSSGDSQSNSGPSNDVTFLAGDANRDGVVNRLDIEAICTAGKYDTNQPANWDEGDFNNDGISNFDDILAMFPNYKDDVHPQIEGCSGASQ